MNMVRGLVHYAVPSFLWRTAPRKDESAAQQQALKTSSNGAPAVGIARDEAGLQLVAAAEARLAGGTDEEKTALALLAAHTDLTPRAQMDMLARLDATPTLLPEKLASLITAASLAARVSLRSSAFLIELIFEASRYGTSAGLGITRRALISAVGTASALHQGQGGWAGEEAGEGGKRSGEQAFLSMLDRYTAVGCYLIHSAFTMTELFAIAGLQLTQSAVSTGFSAAEESVRMFDSLFGSNESSRALSAIIMLVRRELLQDPRFTPSQAGTLASLVALTKALTAFACLQVATRRRTVAGMKMRVVWDATVVAEAEVDNQQLLLPQAAYPDRHGQGMVEALERARQERTEEEASSPRNSLLLTPDFNRHDRRKSIMRLHESDREALVTDVRSQMESGRTWHEDCGGGAGGTISGAASVRSQHRTRSFARVNSIGTMASVGERLAMETDYEEQEEEEQEGAEITYELNRLLGNSEAEEHEEVTGGDELPEEIKRALLEVARGEREPGEAAEGMEVLASRSRLDLHRNGDSADEDVRLIKMNDSAAVYEVTTTTTTTTTTTMVRTTAPVNQQQSSSLSEAGPERPGVPRTDSSVSMHTGSHRHRARSSRGKVEHVFDTPLTRSKSVAEAAQLFREDEWVEVQSRLSHSRSHPDHDGSCSPGIEQEFVPPSVGALARTMTLESPEEGKQKLQVVLKTMTKKLTQRSHTVRRLTTTPGSSPQVRSGETSLAASDEEDGDGSPSNRKKGKVMLKMRNLGDKARKALKPKASGLFERDGATQEPGHVVRGTRKQRSRKHVADLDWAPASKDPREGDRRQGSSRPRNDSRRAPSPNTIPFPAATPSRSQASVDSPGSEDDDTPVQSSRASRRPSSRPHSHDAFASSAPTRSRRASGTSAHSVRTTRTTRTHRTHVETNAVSAGAGGPPMAVYPPGSLVTNLAKYMRYASAAYGQQFLRIMGIGVDAFNYPNTKAHHSNHHAFASHVGIPVDHILLSSFAEPRGFANDQLDPLVHYVAVDSAASAIVLTIRGTLGLSDILLDLTCQYEPVEVDGGELEASYLAHSGMLHSALRLRRESSTVHEALKQALLDYPSYGLVVTGHSLGGGVAALLAVLFSTRAETFRSQAAEEGIAGRHPPLQTPFVTSFRSGLPPGRPIHCYAFGCPAVASTDLGRYCRGLVTSVCHGIDIVPTLSLGVLADLKNVAVSLYEEETVASEIVGRVIGLYQSRRRRKASAVVSTKKPQVEEKVGPGLLAGIDPGEEMVEVEMNGDELAAGRGANLATRKGYMDPALMVADLGREQDEDAPELADWLWSLMRTMRASSDAEKLYPSGDVWHVENFEVFVHDTTPNGKEKLRPAGQQKRTRREGRRIILRACDDVPARFSEPIFGRTMFHDHIPTNYELALQLLEEAVSPPE